MNTKNTVCQNWLDDENKSLVSVWGTDSEWLRIKFQDKPIAEVGPNGICMLDILDAMIARLNQFEQLWPCKENKEAAFHMKEAAFWLIRKRDRRRAERA